MRSHKFRLFLTPLALYHAPMPYALCTCVTQSQTPISPTCVTSFMNVSLLLLGISRIFLKYNITIMSWHVYANITCSLFDLIIF